MNRISRIALYIISGIFLVLMLQNCKHEVPFRKVDPDTKPTETDSCSADTIYFVNDILPIIISNCAKSGCHDAITGEDGVVLNNYANIMNTGEVRPFDSKESKLFEVLNETGDKKMPPPPASMTPEQINAIKIWINQGALNNKCQNKCDTSAVTYSKSIAPIIVSTCQGCHSGTAPGGGIKLTNYAELSTIVKNGKFDGAINHKSGYIPMPPGGQLTACALDKIRIWIADGAKEN